MECDGCGWMMGLAGLTWEEPAGLGIRQTGRVYLDAERRRVVCVAATRARDLLVVPRAGDVPAGRYVCGDLLADALAHLTCEMNRFVEGNEPGWAHEEGLRDEPERADGARVEREVTEWWTAASVQSAQPRFRLASVSGEAHATSRDRSQEGVDAAARKPREGRFGGLFGSAVHHAIGLRLRDRGLTAQEAVRRAARRTGLAEHIEEAVADVARALDALRIEGLACRVGPDLQVEYPVAAAWEGGQVVSGYIDLVGTTDGRLDVIDFKTDAPPPGPVEQIYPEYVAQVRTYGRLLAATGLPRGSRDPLRTLVHRRWRHSVGRAMTSTMPGNPARSRPRWR